MEYSNLINFFMVLSHGFLTVYTTLLMEFREPQRVWRRRWIVLSSLFLLINAFIRCIFQGDSYIRVSLFTLTIPYLLLMAWCSRYKGFRLFFIAFTCLWMACVADSAGIFAQSLWVEYPWIRLLVRIVVYMALYLVLRRLRPYYQRILRILDRGWGILCIIPALTYLTTIYMITNLLPQTPLPAAICICSVTMVCSCAYILIYLFFVRILQEYELKNGRDLLSIQILALQRQSEASRKAEEAMSIQRHDMRHQWTTLSALVEQGDKKAILDFIGAAQKQLDETVVVRWCQNAALNAVFTYYFSQAEHANIKIRAELAIPEQLPVVAQELSMVFSNALENAIKACTALPEEKREIDVKCIQRPRLMLQVENPYTGQIHFDADGLPIAAESGHGIGTRSIVAFCKKHHALWEYQAKDGWFRLRISM